MFKIIGFYNVYKENSPKKDYTMLFNKYFCPTDTIVFKEFNELNNAIKFAQELYNSLDDNKKFNKNGNYIFLARIEVLDYKNEEYPTYIDGFGLSIDEYLKI